MNVGGRPTILLGRTDGLSHGAHVQLWSIAQPIDYFRYDNRQSKSWERRRRPGFPRRSNPPCPCLWSERHFGIDVPVRDRRLVVELSYTTIIRSGIPNSWAGTRRMFD